MATFTYSPTYSATIVIAPRNLVAKFNDGYQLRAPDGINTQLNMWNLTFNKPSSEIDPIESFITSRKGVYYFLWTPCGGEEGIYVCKEWSRSEPSHNISMLTAKFEEVGGGDTTVI